MNRLLYSFAISLGLLIAGPGMAQVDVAKSSIVSISKQMNVPVEGRFKRFTAQLQFDPAKLAEAKASLEIDIASFDIGADDFNKEALKKEWFDAARFPKATFITTAIKAAGPNRYEAVGKLTIKGKSLDVVAPVAARLDGANWIFEGTLPIKRLQFNIGEGDWKDTSMVADEVQIKFRLIAKK